MVKDVALSDWLGAALVEKLHYWAAAAGALFVVGVGYVMTRIRRPAEEEV
jgi:hypothetical protein